MDDNTLFDGLRECLEETLGRRLPDLCQTQRLVGDLGLDSLDLLDLVFRLEKRFSVRINLKGFEARTQQALGDKPMVVDGHYTPEALAQFKMAMPCVPPSELADGLPVSQLVGLFRVKTFMNMISEVLSNPL
ncbi:MAG: phosphopantetheine-binding protein [Deltaproteobacteria bacterium]|jgi:acyl carrier protein|nr:phosphopantetheine-binding protein [Deltaproteobacteria bacterium]